MGNGAVIGPLNSDMQHTPAVIPGYTVLHSNVSWGSLHLSNVTQVTLSCTQSIHMHIILHSDGVASLNQAVNMTLCRMSLNNSPCLDHSVDVSTGT